jgi:uncharacterized protein (UPF0335 family)
MAKPKQAETGTITASEVDITRCVAFHDQEKEAAAVLAENAEAALEPLANKGMHLAALKMAMKLRKLDPHEQREWLASFEVACEALAVGAQLEMPLEASPAAPAPSALN